MTRKQATIAVRSGLNDDEQYGCVVPPIHLSSTYNFTGFNEPRAHDYSRRGNPTRDVVQRALAELEGGAGAVLTNTGMSAILLVTTVFLKPGDLLVAPHDCYGGSYRLFDSLAKRGCYRVLFVDQNDEQALSAALAEKPKLVLVESPSNPLLRVVDIAKICGLAREAGAVSVVDNTFLSPALQNPLALGADLVLHSCTKYLNGHSDVVAGVVIAKDPATVTELAWWANNIGVTGGAFDSYLLLRGLRTLSPRMEVAQRNALAIVDYLKSQPLVKKLYHPSLPENQGHEIAARQQKGFGAMLSFELDGDEQTLRLSVKDKLRLFTLKRDPTALFARLIQRFVEVVQLFDVFDQRRVLFAQILIALQHMPDLGIGQARMGTHHCFVELIARQTSLAGDGHFADHTQAVHLRVEGTQAVGEHFWQHRYNLRREVDRRTAAARFVIQRRVWTHVVAHIRDSHPQTPATTTFFLTVHGIIEVTGVFTINGDQRQIAQIHAACFGLFRHFFTQVFDLVFNRFRPDVRNFMGAQRHINGHAGAHVIAQHFNDFTHRFGTAGRALGEFNHHHKAHACAHHLFRRDENVEAQTA